MYKSLIVGMIALSQTQVNANCLLATSSFDKGGHTVVIGSQMIRVGSELSGTRLDVAEFGSTFSEQFTDLISRELIEQTVSIESLPSKVQTFIKERSKTNPDYISKLPLLEERYKKVLAEKSELSFTSASIYSLPDKSKQYEVLVKFYGITDLPIVFDENGNVIWVGSFQRLEGLTNLDNLSDGKNKLSEQDISFFTDQFKVTPEFKDFTIKEATSNSEASINSYADVKSYQFQLSKQTDRETEFWILRYNADKKMISSFYSVK